MIGRIMIIAIIAVTPFFSYSQKEMEFTPYGKPIIQVFATSTLQPFDDAQQNYNFNIGRAHLGYQYWFSEHWSAKIIIDRGKATSVGQLTFTDIEGNTFNVQNTSKEGACYTMFLKFASLQWKVNNRLTLEGGAILQNHYITQERFWGLRYLAQTFQDLYWHIPSSDLGFIAYYKLNNFISFDVALTNGEGPRNLQDAFGKVKLSGGIDIKPSKKIQTRIFYHHKQSGIDSTATEQMFSVFIGYKPSVKIRIGGEYDYMSNLDNADGLDNCGFSFFAAYHLTDKMELFARYDKLFNEIPEYLNAIVTEEGNMIIGGISYTPVEGINISLNYQGWISDDNVSKNKNSILLSMEYKF